MLVDRSARKTVSTDIVLVQTSARANQAIDPRRIIQMFANLFVHNLVRMGSAAHQRNAIAKKVTVYRGTFRTFANLYARYRAVLMGSALHQIAANAKKVMNRWVTRLRLPVNLFATLTAGTVPAHLRTSALATRVTRKTQKVTVSHSANFATMEPACSLKSANVTKVSF